MTTADAVEGVAVDTRHWIGGERVSSATTFDDISPIDETVIAEIHAGGREPRSTPRCTAAQARVPGLGGDCQRHERAEILRAVADRRRRTRRGSRPGRDPRQRLAAAVSPARGDASGGQQLPVLRRLSGVARSSRRRDPRPSGTGDLRSGRRRSDHHAVERATDARHLADRSGPGGRQHRRRQAARVGTPDRVAAGRHHEAGGPAGRRVQRRPGHRRPGRGAAHGTPRASAGCPSPVRFPPPV